MTLAPILSLTYRGIDFCDGCGVRLEPEARLSGLCPQCEATLPPGEGNEHES